MPKFVEKLEAKNDAEAEVVSEMEKEVFNLDEKLQAMRSDPSDKEKLEKEKAMLEEDIRKFHALIDGFKLKIGDDLQYDLNKSSMAKLEEFISLQQQSQDKDSKLKEKRSPLTKNLSRIDAVESQLSVVEKEIQEYASTCSAEAKRITEDLEQEMHKLDKTEREEDEFLKTSSAKLQDLIKKNDEEIQKCAHELLMLVDSVSKYKESMESTLLNIRRDVSETAEAFTRAPWQLS
ncbi:hypothetical protein IFM89_024482 [Coptis chinensis]|uniref:Uncharacterized protein n=1 Tax=Coptis chinensis TaxID=261450 RepID=A0A835LGB3_9MAGN|nr:hypothetical protein IFM89_024482 [Coptis chinensis]